MTDLHTHILPAMDDGSRDLAESLALLELERSQGIDTVVLTPHFCRWRESAEHFLQRRAGSFEALQRALPVGMPQVLLGAEVAWFPSLGQEPLDLLCLGGSKFFLLELPFEPWSSRLMDQIYDLSCATGLTPVFAHVERYVSTQSKRQVEELKSLGFPMQMNIDSLLALRTRGKCKKLLHSGRWYLGSDCHDIQSRPPRWEKVTQIFGAEEIAYRTEWIPGKDV